MVTADKEVILHHLVFTRLFEEKAMAVYEDKGIPETVHSSIGQEAVGVGACQALEEHDIIVPTLRTRAAMLLRIPLEEIVAGMFGTRSGPSNGRTTHHHLGDTDAGILGTTGMVGSHLNPSVGAGLGNKILGNDSVTLSFLGDGASTRGEFHSALNFATVYDVPIVFVIENNEYTELTRIEELTAVDDLAEFGSHGLSTEVVDGQDVMAVHKTAHEYVERARAGEGPALIEAKTHRFRPHMEAISDTRDPEELEALRERDPVDLFTKHLIDEGVIDREDIEALREELKADIDAAFEFVEQDEPPEEEVMYHVYKDSTINEEGVIRRE